jgi:TonB family protein
MTLRTWTAASVFFGLAVALGAPHAEAATIALLPLGGGATSALTTQCTQADRPAAIDAAFFEVPTIAQAMHASGESLVRIDLDAAGQLRTASLQRSSGNRWLDLAALQTAHLSRYRPEVQNCARIGGSYLIAVVVSEDDVR